MLLTVLRNRSALPGRALAHVVGTAAVVSAAWTAAAAGDLNVARYRFATGGSTDGEAVPTFALDGKLGPENRWITSDRGRHRLNIFFERPTEIGTVHIYSGGDRDGPIDSFSLQYRDASGSMIDVPGASVSGNQSWFAALALPTPVTTTQLQVSIPDDTATVQEIAVFPTDAVAPAFGDGIDPHLARQHRLALTTASSTIAGTSRRATVDGFVNENGYWKSAASPNESLVLDMRDPPETDPPSIRAVTSPLEIGSVHVYSGLPSQGVPPISRGRLQFLDESTQMWVDIPGGDISSNTSYELAVQFDEPVTTAALRLIVQDLGGVVRELVPLPPNDGNGWPLGAGVSFGDPPDVRTYDDDFYEVSLGGSGLAMTSMADGTVELLPAAGRLGQQYQLLLNVGSDAYRVRSRVTGLCLEPQDGSVAVGAPVVETVYAGLPTQHWRVESVAGGVRLVNSASGHTLAATSGSSGALLAQDIGNGANQTWTTTRIVHAPKKGVGGFPDLAGGPFEAAWAYNWGPNDTFVPEVDFWPMQWGSFNWTQRPSLMPLWQRNAEPIVLMGYNEPDKEEQANMSVFTGASMWPRLEVLNMPLLGPAVAGHPASSTWIQDFMAQADADEMRVDYVGMHSYGGPNASSFIQKITDAHLAWDRDVVVSEFSVVDWSDTNSWTTDAVYHFFAEVLWRMEDLPYLHRYAVFVFTDDPGNSISDNRGEMREADGSLTPEGKLYAAWDADTQIRSDTPYHLHNNATHARPGAVPGQQGTASVVMGDRFDDSDAFQWLLVPSSTPGFFRITSVADGRVITYSSRGLDLQAPTTSAPIAEFRPAEIEHGWFALEEPILGRRLASTGTQSDDFELAPAGSVDTNTRWRFVPVYQGVPGPPRDGQATSVGRGEVVLTWAEHGFRDLFGYNVYRVGPAGGTPELVAAEIMTESWVDTVPVPGMYAYTVTAVGDTGESVPSSLGTIAVETCPADFDGNFVADAADVQAAVAAIESGFDFNSDANADFFDVLDYLRVFDEGCPGD